MNEAHDLQHAAIADVGERPETPPPPYNFEDSNPFSTSNLHDPELAELESDLPYQVRGSTFLVCSRFCRQLKGN